MIDGSSIQSLVIFLPEISLENRSFRRSLLYLLCHSLLQRRESWGVRSVSVAPRPAPRASRKDLMGAKLLTGIFISQS